MELLAALGASHWVRAGKLPLRAAGGVDMIPIAEEVTKACPAHCGSHGCVVNGPGEARRGVDLALPVAKASRLCCLKTAILLEKPGR